jgi:23S rRNA (cytosine1962-C5)-methyltransferase
MELLTPKHWKDFELLDSGDFEKLERFGNFITIRPEPQAVWDKIYPDSEWKKRAHVKFNARSSSSGVWDKTKQMPDQWQIKYAINGKDEEIRFRLGLTAFKHVGVFPEQAENWDYIYSSLKKVSNPAPKFLNLFAYTGGASLAARAAGAEVTHCDSVRQVVTWARENMEISGLDNIRWMVEDALKYVKREIKRGNKYNGIILDPPAYGHGPNGEKWKLEDNINEMMKSVVQILDEKEHFLILNAYSLGFSSLIIENLLADPVKKYRSALSTGELYLQAASGSKLPLGVFGRMSNL